VANSKDYKVEGQKGLAFDASVWVRMSRTTDPVIVGARSVHTGVRPGADDPQPVKDFTLEWLIFDALRCDPRQAHVRDLREIDIDEGDGTFDPAEVRQLLADARRAGAVEEFMPYWNRANENRWMNLMVEGVPLEQLLRQEAIRIKEAAAAPPPPADTAQAWPAQADQLSRIHILLGKCGLTDPANKRVTLGLLVGRQLESSKELTHPEAAKIAGLLRGFTERDSDPAAALAKHLANLPDRTSEATHGSTG
jgi:hypothetical protein